MKIRLMLIREGRRRKITINGPRDVLLLLAKESKGLDREHFWRIDLNSENRVLGYEVIAIGTLTRSLVHPREVFKGAILNNAAGIIVAHNHPTGDPAASLEDRKTTRRLTRAGQLLGVPVLDHVVIADRLFFSFRERGLLGRTE